MHFQIYVPETPTTAPGCTAAAALPGVGLSSLVANAEGVPCAEGPDGRSGTVFAWRDPSKGAAGMQMGYRPDEQTAHFAYASEGFEAERYTVLVWKDAPPTPAELAHRYPPFGKPFEFAGESWHVPSPLDLPADILHNRAGEPIYALQPEFHPFTRLADSLLERIQREAYEEIRDGDVVACLIAALKINYRLTLEVADAVRMFSTQNVGEPLQHAIAADRAAEIAEGA